MSILSNRTFQGIVFALIGFSSFSFGDVIIKYLRDFYTPYTIAFFTTFFCSLTLIASSPLFGGLRSVRNSKKLKWHIGRGLLLTAEFLLFIYSFAFLPMTTAYALIFATPFLASLLAIPLLGEKVTTRQWAAILLGFVGVLVVLRPGVVPLGLPVMAALLGALFFAFSNVMVRMIGEEGETPLTFALVAEAVICGVTFLLFLTQPEIPTLFHLFLLVWVGLFSAVALFCMPLAFLRAPAAVISPFHYVQMLWGVLFGYVFFGDLMSIWIAAGSTIIIVSGIWLIRQERGKVPDYGAV